MQVQVKDNTVLSNCTLDHITNMCFNYNLYQLVLGVTRDTDLYIQAAEADIPESANDWINTNLDDQRPSYSAVNFILDAYGCTTAVDGTYSCAID